jgi:hypothetical protein
MSEAGLRANASLAGRNNQAEETMIHEIRVYRCVPMRLPALLKRFETITLKLWEKHGIRQAGFWTTLIGESNHDLTYMLAWASLAEREQKWNAFMSDPEWIQKRAETEKDGPIVETISNQIFTPTGFSSVK